MIDHDHAADLLERDRQVAARALREFRPKCPVHGVHCSPPCRLPEYLRNQLDAAARDIEATR